MLHEEYESLLGNALCNVFLAVENDVQKYQLAKPYQKSAAVCMAMLGDVLYLL